MGVLLEKGIGCKLAGLAAGGAEEIEVLPTVVSSGAITKTDVLVAGAGIAEFRETPMLQRFDKA